MANRSYTTHVSVIKQYNLVPVNLGERTAPSVLVVLYSAGERLKDEKLEMSGERFRTFMNFFIS